MPVERLSRATKRQFARIAVVANDALGNYAVSTPLLQAVRREYEPTTLDYYAGTRTQELWAVDPHIDHGFAVLGSAWTESLADAHRRGPYDLVINLESSCWAYALTTCLCGPESYVVGPCLDSKARGMFAYGTDSESQLAQDLEWIAEDLVVRYPMLKSGFIGEIFCRLAYIEGPIPPYSIPRAPAPSQLPQVLIATSASLEEKLWPVEYWVEAIQALTTRGFEVGLLGAAPAAQREFWRGDGLEEVLVKRSLVRDLRGTMTLPEVVGAIGAAKAVLTLDNGILHLAAATDTPIVGLFREGIHRLWAPPVPGLTVLIPAPGEPVSKILPSRVAEALARVL